MMKNIKYLLFLGLFLIPLNTNAASSSISLSCPSTANPGSTISCSISMTTSGTTANGISAVYSFDSGLSYGSFTTASAFSPLKSTSTGFALSGSGGVPSNVSIGTLKVKIASTVNGGQKYQVTLNNIQVSDTEYKDIQSNKTASQEIRIKSSNNNLSNLSVSGHEINFNKNTTTYTLETTSSKVTVNATKEDSYATISGTGTKSLSYGLNTIKVVVTSETGSKKTYTINITRKDTRSDDAKLSSLTISNANINFTTNQTIYNTSVESNISKVQISATTNNDKASFVSGYGPRTVNLSYGKNTFKLEVKSEKGTTRTYTINITRKDTRSSNNNLSSLSVSVGKINFNKNTITYNIDTKNDVTSATISATLEDQKSTFVSGYAPRTVSLKEGFNSFQIKVKNEKGTIKTYTINITREDGKSRNNNLKEITLSTGNITFDKNNLNYNVTVEYEIEKLTINATPEDSKAKVTYQKENTLKVGENKIIITVEAENKSTKNYTITVTRKEEGKKLSNVSSLSSLYIDGKQITLNENQTEYTYQTTQTAANVKATPTDSNANVTVMGNTSIKDGSIIQIIVTAEDQSTTVYKIKIEQKEEKNNTMLIILIPTIIIVIGIITFAILTKNKNKPKEIDANLLNLNRK